MSRYRVSLRYDAQRELFIARAPELPECYAEGETRAAALAGLEDEIGAQLATITEHGGAVPVPVDEMVVAEAEEGEAPAGPPMSRPAPGTLDGRVAAKISPSLHRELVYHARGEGLPLDVLVGELIAESLALRSARELRGARPRGSGGERERGRSGNRRRPQQRGGPSYGELMEDKASFLEYVRGLEQQPGGRGRRGGRNRGRGRNPEGGSGT